MDFREAMSRLESKPLSSQSETAFAGRKPKFHESRVSSWTERTFLDMRGDHRSVLEKYKMMDFEWHWQSS